jgi:hypothetical protein
MGMYTGKKHLEDSQMTYWYHFKHSMANAGRLLILAGSSFIHAIFPFLYKQHAARGIIRIYNRMKRYAHLKKLQDDLKDS